MHVYKKKKGKNFVEAGRSLLPAKRDLAKKNSHDDIPSKLTS